MKPLRLPSTSNYHKEVVAGTRSLRFHDQVSIYLLNNEYLWGPDPSIFKTETHNFPSRERNREPLSGFSLRSKEVKTGDKIFAIANSVLVIRHPKLLVRPVA